MYNDISAILTLSCHRSKAIERARVVKWCIQRSYGIRAIMKNLEFKPWPLEPAQWPLQFMLMLVSEIKQQLQQQQWNNCVNNRAVKQTTCTSDWQTDRQTGW